MLNLIYIVQCKWYWWLKISVQGPFKGWQAGSQISQIKVSKNEVGEIICRGDHLQGMDCVSDFWSCMYGIGRGWHMNNSKKNSVSKLMGQVCRPQWHWQKLNVSCTSPLSDCKTTSITPPFIHVEAHPPPLRFPSSNFVQVVTEPCGSVVLLWRHGGHVTETRDFQLQTTQLLEASCWFSFKSILLRTSGKCQSIKRTACMLNFIYIVQCKWYLLLKISVQGPFK